MKKCLFCGKILRKKKRQCLRDKRGWQWETPAQFKKRHFCGYPCSPHGGRRIVKEKWEVIEELYKNFGFSINKIARFLKVERTTILWHLKRRGLANKHPGRIIEEEVANWLKQRKKTVVAQRGDWPFDLLVDGEKIDVKSTSQQADRWGYRFQLQCLKERKQPKDLYLSVDKYYLVFLDLPDRPIYSLESHLVEQYQQMLMLPLGLNSKKYPLQFIGYLGGGKV